MTRPLLVSGLICLCTVFASFAFGAPPNVVLILTDDQGTLDAHSFGATDLHTPSIDALAARGVRFTQAYAHTVCCPARAMLMTGRHPQRSDVNSWMQGETYGPKGRNMLLREVTLAALIRTPQSRDGDVASGVLTRVNLRALRASGGCRQ